MISALFFGILCWAIIYWRNSPIGLISVQHIQKAPMNFPLIGHSIAILLNYSRIYDWLYETSANFKFTPWVFQFLFSPAYVVVCDPKSVEHVLKGNFENYVKGEYFSARTIDLLGHGIFNSDGEHWKLQRKTASTIFNVKNFRDFVSQVFKKEMDKLTLKLNEAANDESIINLSELFFRFTLDGFCEIGFNIQLNSMNQTEPEPFAVAFDRAQSVVDYRFFNPLWRLDKLFNGGQMNKDLAIIKSFCSKIISERRSNLNESFNDLLSRFMNIKATDDLPMYSDEELADVVLNFIIAGRDTTAQALSWAIYCLEKNPSKKVFLMDEINRLLPQKSGETTLEDIKELKYAKAVFLEALRLFPSVPKNMKTAVSDDHLPDGTFIPAGTSVVWSPFAMARSKSIWGANAREFVPERWLEQTANQFEYPVFHAGPRICLGKSMAEIEGVFVLVSVLKDFDLKVTNLQEITYANSVTLPMLDGLQVKVSKRI